MARGEIRAPLRPTKSACGSAAAAPRAREAKRESPRARRRPPGRCAPSRPCPRRAPRRGRGRRDRDRARELGKPQAGRIRELEQRAVAQRERVGAFDLHETDRFVGRERRRQLARAARRLQSYAGIVLDRRIALLQEAVERAPRREHPREAPTREPAAVQRREKPPQLARGQLSRARCPCRGGQHGRVTNVGASRVGGPCRQRLRESLEQRQVCPRDGMRGQIRRRGPGHRARNRGDLRRRQIARGGHARELRQPREIDGAHAG